MDSALASARHQGGRDLELRGDDAGDEADQFVVAAFDLAPDAGGLFGEGKPERFGWERSALEGATFAAALIPFHRTGQGRRRW